MQQGKTHHRSTLATRLLTAVVAFTLAVPLTALGVDGAASAQTQRFGFEFVGNLQDAKYSDPHTGGSADGALLLAPRQRRAYQYFFSTDEDTNQDFVEFRVYDIDSFVDGFAEELDRIRIDAKTGLVDGDTSRRSVKKVGIDPLIEVDDPGGRLLYHTGDGIREIDVDTGEIQKWSPTDRPPGPSGDPIDGLAGGVGSNLVTEPLGWTYDEGGDGIQTEPRIYEVGEFRDQGGRTHGTYVAAWDASPSADGDPDPDGRQLWLYPIRTCRDLDRSASTQVQTDVVRAGATIYTYCDSSSDGSGRGVLRLPLGDSALGRLSPTTTEEFFPGVTGAAVHVFSDPLAERVHFHSRNASAKTRNVLVFDGTVADGAGGYIGEIALSRTTKNTTTGLDPVTGRWYLQSDEGLWYQDGRLRLLAQANRFKRDLDGGDLTGATAARPMSIDPAVLDAQGRVVRPARIFVERAENLWDIYEDRSPLPLEPPPPDERTINEPEGPGNVGVYSGVTSAYGVRLRLMRGLSSFVPNGVPFVDAASLENPNTTSPPKSPSDYFADPFFFHAGECGSKDRELAFGRVLQTSLAGGIFNRDASAAALAVDPDVHRPSAADDTQTRDDLANPDPVADPQDNSLPDEEGCLRRLFETMTGHDTDPRDGNFNELGQDWPYDTVACVGDEASDPAEATGPVAGTATVGCEATADEASVTAETHTELGPGTGLVTVGETLVATDIERTPGEGLTATSESVVKNITVAGTVELEQIRVQATATAKGFATDEGSTATVTTEREFSGLTVAGVRVCEHCGEATVLDALNAAIGTMGYVRVSDPEPDFALGTVKGTLAVVQKDLLLQAADGTTNRDFSSEWAGLEIGVYRDGVTRGRGRWVMQLGGVFAQSQFGVITELAPLGDFTQDDFEVDNVEVAETTVIPAVDPVVEEPETIVVEVEPKKAAQAAPAVDSAGGERIIDRIKEGLKRNLGAALLTAALWSLVYGPVYLARRRGFLKQLSGT